MYDYDLECLISACPALTSLTIDNVVSPGDVDHLLDLPGSCVQLAVAGVAWDDDAALVVCELTQLHSLAWHNAINVTLQGEQACAHAACMMPQALRLCRL
jgi:hypothetical protein